MKDEIIKLCKSIKENNKCESCTGRFNNHTCIYCGIESEILKDLENKLINILNNVTIDEEILMNLYSIKSLNIEKVNNILNENNYEEKLNNKYNEICTKINSDNLNNEDHKYMIYFIENNIIANDMNLLINVLMKEMLLGKVEMTNSSKLILIKNFTEMFMRDFMKGRVKNPKCTFEKLEDNTFGESFYDRITLDEKDIIEMLESKKYVKVLETIFHECTHTYQYYTMSVEKTINYNNLLQTKEEIIKNSNKDYYNENYEMYASEVEARYMQSYLTLQYLQILELSTSEEKIMQQNMLREQELFMVQTRKNNGIDTTVDEMFLSINDVNSLYRYPVLNVQFKMENNTLVMKTEQELIDDYNNYKNGILKLNGNPNEIEYLYNYLIDSMKQNKERS